MATKRKPHHDLSAIQAKFANVGTLEMTSTAVRGARAIGYALEDVIDVVQSLEPRDFVKSETAHSPPNPRVWHDSYRIRFDDVELYLKFAGETLVDVTLTSFKEAFS